MVTARTLSKLAALSLVLTSLLPDAQSQSCPPQTLCTPPSTCRPPSCPPGNTVQQTAQVTVFTNALQPPQSNQIISVPRFTPAAGQTLVQAEVHVAADIVNGSIQARNLAHASIVNQNFTLQTTVGIYSSFAPLLPPGTALQPASATFNDNFPPTTWPGPPANPCDFTGPDAVTHANLFGHDERLTCITDPASLASDFTAAGGLNTVDFTYSSADSSTHVGGGNLCILYLNFTKVTVSVTYTYCQNTPPVANDDTASVCRLGQVDIPVLANDFDPNGGLLNCASLVILQNPTHGTATIVQNCSAGAPCPGVCIHYVSTDPSFTGTDTLIYRITDNTSRTDTATVSISVCAVVAADDRAITTCAGQPVDIPVLQNDTASCGLIDCNSLVITTPPAHGTAVINNSCGSGAPCPSKCIRYTPDASYSGPDSFVYSISNTGTPTCSDTATVTINVCRVNPVADSATVCAGGTVDIPVLLNDTTNCGTLNCASLAIVSQPAQGTAALQTCTGQGGTACPNACIRYTAPANPTVSQVTFTYSIANNSTPACSGTGTVTVNLCRVNPTNDSATVCAGGTVDIPVLANDTTTCGALNCSSLAIASQPAQGTATLQTCTGQGGTACPNACIRYTAPANPTVSQVTFTYTISNNSTPVCSATGTVTVNLCRTDALPDTATACAGGTVDIPVLANDTTSCGALNCASLTIVSQPAQGTAALQTCTGQGGTACPNACIRYTAPANPTVTQVTFTYSISNNSTPVCSSTGTVTVNLCRVNTANDTASVCAGGTVDIPVLANDTTTCGALNCGSLAIASQPAQGTATLQTCTGQGGTACPNACIRYTAPANPTVTQVTFTYTISNNSTPVCSATGTVTVNLCATTAAPDTASVCAGGTVDIPVLANDTTTCGALNCAALAIATQPAQGTAALQTCTGQGGTACPNACIRYTAPANPTVTQVTFTYTIANNSTPACPATGTVTVNLCRTDALADSANVCAGGTVDIPVLLNDTTTCGALNCASLAIVSQPSQGTAALQTCTGQGGTACPNACIRYTAPANPTVSQVTFTYSIANNSTPACSATGTVTVNLCSTTAAPDTATVCAGGTVDIPVLANDSTTCGALNCGSLAIVSQPAQGTVALQTCTGQGGTACPNACVRYTAPANPTVSQVTFTYSIANNSTPACSATGTVTVNLCRVNPTNDSATVCAGGTVDIPVLANDTTTCGALNCGSLAIASQPAQGTATLQTCTGQGGTACPNACIRYTAPANPTVSQVTFTYTISNNSTPACTASGTVTVTLCSTTAAPDTASVCVGGTVDIPVLANDTTTCGALNCSTLAIATQPSQGTVALQTCTGQGGTACPNACIRYTAPANPTVTQVTFTYTVSNNSTPACPATGTVTVNLCRTTAAGDTAAVCAGGSVDIPVLANDTTTCGALNCASLTILSQPTQGTATRQACSGQGGTACPNACIRYTAPANPTVSQVTFTYSIANNSTPACTATGTVTVNICGVNAGDVSGLRVCAGDTLDVCVPVSTTSANCGQINCSSLTITVPPGQGTATPQTNCTSCGTGTCCIRYTAPANPTVGQVTFTYQVSNNLTPSCSDTGTVTINLCRLTAAPDVATICQGEVAVIPVLNNDNTNGTGTGCGALDCHTLTIVTPPDPAAGTATVDAGCATGACSSCVIRFTPTVNFVGQCQFTYRISTSGTPACSATTTVTVDVHPLPVANDDTFTIQPGASPPYSIDILANDSPGQGCTYLTPPLTNADFITLPTHGSVVFNPVTNQAEYTPNPTFAGSDSFCYRLTNSCGCVDTACAQVQSLPPCPTVNRSECGSLLLFPEYDNRQGSLTMLTITDACCGNPAANTKVELVYIDKTTCTETNRTYTLTPCDTLTLLTSASGTAGTRGYAYAFAKGNASNAANPNGIPIVFNHLIGQSVTINGISVFEYSLNAVVFKAYGADGALNDDDNDGIRDFNGDPTQPNLPGQEYDQAPDRIVIPRFLGQDNVGGQVSSDIVLVALSGGSEFTTTLSIQGFNDNETDFSAQYTFHCWDKVPLRTFTAGTSQANLQINNDPQEIVGWNTREAGWLLLDGLVANSTQENIADPAFYAVLIEGVNGEQAADLPFELCLQANGDLLPHSLMGDGPNPVVGDNQ